MGWLTADSRYRLTVNGQRVQWGPAPCDPRQLDVDPLDITALLRPGKNVIGVEVLYYGIGEGHLGRRKTGLDLSRVVTHRENKSLRIVSDDTWQCLVDRAHPPAQPKRWFLRLCRRSSMRASIRTAGTRPNSHRTDEWVSAMLLACPADKPPSCSSYSTTDSLDQAAPATAHCALGRFRSSWRRTCRQRPWPTAGR